MRYMVIYFSIMLWMVIAPTTVAAYEQEMASEYFERDQRLKIGVTPGSPPRILLLTSFLLVS